MPDLTSDEETIRAVATILGRRGGSRKSEAKTRSSRANGRLGGRPQGPPIPDVESEESCPKCGAWFGVYRTKHNPPRYVLKPTCKCRHKKKPTK